MCGIGGVSERTRGWEAVFLAFAPGMKLRGFDVLFIPSGLKTSRVLDFIRQAGIS